MAVTTRGSRRQGLNLILTVAISALLLVWSADPVSAHGKEVEIETTALTPDSSLPLTRLYRAVVTFTDGDPVEGAEMTLSAVRAEDGTSIDPVLFQPLGPPGRYVAEVEFLRFGNWQITIEVAEPGEGAAQFVDAVLPGGTSGGSADDGAAPRSETLSVLFKFDGGDLANVVVRVVHSLAGAVWVALIGLAVVGCCLAGPGPRDRILGTLKRFFVPAATLSLLVILGSGLHSAIWGTPINEPGVFDLDTLLDIPFGGPYVAALAGMALAWVLMVFVTLRMRAGLQQWTAHGESAVGGVRSSAVAGVAITVFLAIDITVLLYLHNISHLSLVIPQ